MDTQSKYITCIIPKIDGSNLIVPIGYVGYKLRSRGTKTSMTLYHIAYVEVGKTLFLLGIISVTICH